MERLIIGLIFAISITSCLGNDQIRVPKEVDASVVTAELEGTFRRITNYGTSSMNINLSVKDKLVSKESSRGKRSDQDEDKIIFTGILTIRSPTKGEVVFGVNTTVIMREPEINYHVAKRSTPAGPSHKYGMEIYGGFNSGNGQEPLGFRFNWDASVISETSRTRDDWMNVCYDPDTYSDLGTNDRTEISFKGRTSIEDHDEKISYDSLYMFTQSDYNFEEKPYRFIREAITNFLIKTKWNGQLKVKSNICGKGIPRQVTLFRLNAEFVLEDLEDNPNASRYLHPDNNFERDAEIQEVFVGMDGNLTINVDELTIKREEFNLGVRAKVINDQKRETDQYDAVSYPVFGLGLEFNTVTRVGSPQVFREESPGPKVTVDLKAWQISRKPAVAR